MSVCMPRGYFGDEGGARRDFSVVLPSSEGLACSVGVVDVFRSWFYPVEM